MTTLSLCTGKVIPPKKKKKMEWNLVMKQTQSRSCHAWLVYQLTFPSPCRSVSIQLHSLKCRLVKAVVRRVHWLLQPLLKREFKMSSLKIKETLCQCCGTREPTDGHDLLLLWVWKRDLLFWTKLLRHLTPWVWTICWPEHSSFLQMIQLCYQQKGLKANLISM